MLKHAKALTRESVLSTHNTKLSKEPTLNCIFKHFKSFVSISFVESTKKGQRQFDWHKIVFLYQQSHSQRPFSWQLGIPQHCVQCFLKKKYEETGQAEDRRSRGKPNKQTNKNKTIYSKRTVSKCIWPDLQLIHVLFDEASLGMVSVAVKDLFLRKTWEKRWRYAKLHKNWTEHHWQ